MTSENHYKNRIQEYGWTELQSFFQAIKENKTPDWEQGKAFEYLVLRIFELDGAEVVWPYSVEVNAEVIEQIDGVIYYEHLSCLVESKHTAKAVNAEPLAKLRSQIMRRPNGIIGLLFSYNGFTHPARILAQYLAPQTTLLWNGREIEYSLQKEKICEYLMKKFRVCVEEGLPDFNIREEEKL